MESIGRSEDRLLYALAEQLKFPLLNIARTAERGRVVDAPEVLRMIEHTADMTLRLIDSYLLGVQLAGESTLDLEPVSASALLQSVAHRLSLHAKDYSCDVELRLGGKYVPVMAQQRALEAAYLSLGQAFIESAPADGRRHRIVLGVHKSAHGIVVGVFGNQPELTADMYRRARVLMGSARQAFPGFGSGSGAGVFVAERLLAALHARLRVARYDNLTGMAATFVPSQQISLLDMVA